MEEKAQAENPQSLPKICIIYAHPSKTEGKCQRILERVQKTYAAANAPVALIDLYRENFNPIMSEGEWKKFETKTQLPDVARLQKIISDSEVLVFIYPVWWSVPPAILKGFIDRVFTPGFAYKYEGEKISGLLNGKRALIVRTFAGGAEIEQQNGQVASNFLERTVLGSCGIRATSVDLYSMEGVAPTTFEHHLFQVEGAARRMLASPSGVPHHLRWIPAPHLPPVTGAPRRQEKEENSPKPQLDPEAEAGMKWAAQELRSRKSDWRAGEGKGSIGQPPKKGFYDGKGKHKGKKLEHGSGQMWGRGQNKSQHNQAIFTGDSTRAQAWVREHNKGGADYWAKGGQGKKSQNQNRGSPKGSDNSNRQRQKKHFSTDSYKRTRNYFGRQK